MTRILIVKLSSMGDVIHALPMLSDIKDALGEVTIDWLTEPAYACLLETHPLINQVLTVPLRRHKGHLLQFYRSKEAKALRHYFKAHPYDFIIDAQGLLKSTWLSRWAKGMRCGYDKHSCREPLSSYLLNQRHAVSKHQHAITRMRQLAALSLGYEQPSTLPNYLLNQQHTQHAEKTRSTIMLMPFTTWPSKHWPKAHWHVLIQTLSASHNIVIAWGTDAEKEQALHYCKGANNTEIAPPSNIADMLSLLKTCDAFIACDTGFAHLATALNIPGVVLMGPTDSKQSGPLGPQQIALDIALACRPCHKRHCHLSYASGELKPACMAGIQPDHVAQTCIRLIKENK